MRSASPQGPREDLAAHARIRDAAIARFAREGFARANLRAVAADAGVSMALIFHHYGNKGGLRAACDGHVMRSLTERAGVAGETAGVQDLLADYLSSPEEYRLHVQYMVRAVEEDGAVADTFVSRLVDESEARFTAGAADGTMHKSSDPRALAVLSVMVSLSVLTMPPPFARALGSKRFGPEALRRMTRPVLELYTRGVYTDDALLAAADDAWAAADPSQQNTER